jgi:hypothetical protein
MIKPSAEAFGDVLSSSNQPLEQNSTCRMTNLIASWFQRAIDQTAAGYGDWCVTATSNNNPAHWFQVTGEHLNLAFPFDCEPKDIIEKLPNVPFFEIVAYEPNTYLTLAHGAGDSLPMLAQFVSMYMDKYLKDPVTDGWTMKEEEL